MTRRTFHKITICYISHEKGAFALSGAQMDANDWWLSYGSEISWSSRGRKKGTTTTNQ